MTLKRHKELSPNGVMESLKPGVDYQVGNLARAYGVSSTEMRVVMEELTEDGFLERLRAPRGIAYKVRSVLKRAERGGTPAPYPHVLPNGPNLQGYEKGLRDFSDLCLISRR